MSISYGIICLRCVLCMVDLEGCMNYVWLFEEWCKHKTSSYRISMSTLVNASRAFVCWSGAILTLWIYYTFLRANISIELQSRRGRGAGIEKIILTRHRTIHIKWNECYQYHRMVAYTYIHHKHIPQPKHFIHMYVHWISLCIISIHRIAIALEVYWTFFTSSHFPFLRCYAVSYELHFQSPINFAHISYPIPKFMGFTASVLILIYSMEFISNGIT